MPATDADFVIHAYGPATVWMFEPVSDAAKAACESIEIDPWQWLGDRFAVDHRAASALVAALVEDGYSFYHAACGAMINHGDDQ